MASYLSIHSVNYITRLVSYRIHVEPHVRPATMPMPCVSES